MKLTNYGRKVLSRAAAAAVTLVLVAGALLLELDGAHWFLMGQKAFNLLYIVVIMPAGMAMLCHIAFKEYDRRSGMV